MTDKDILDTAADSFDEARFRMVMGHFATGVTIVTAMDGEEPVGLTAQSFTSLSLDPPLVSFAPGKASSSWPRIQAAGAFCVNFLGEQHEVLCRTFATKGADKFAQVQWIPGTKTGSPVLTDALAWVDCSIEVVHEAGDHLIVIGRVLDLDVEDDGKPLLFYRGGFGRFEA